MREIKSVWLRIWCILLVGLLYVQTSYSSEIERELALNIEWDTQGNPRAINGSDIVGLIYLPGSNIGISEAYPLVRATYVDIPIDPQEVWKVSNEISIEKEDISIRLDSILSELGNTNIDYRDDLSLNIMRDGNYVSFSPYLLEAYYQPNLQYVARLLIPLDAYDRENNVLVTIDQYRFGLKSIPMKSLQSAMDSQTSLDCQDIIKGAAPISVNNVANSTDPNYYIITSKSFKDIAEKICVWQREKGKIAQISYIEDILASTQFEVGSIYHETQLVDKAASLRAYLHSLHSGHYRDDMSIFFIGNEEAGIPIRKLRNYKDTTEYDKEFSGACFIPTDGYYSDIYCEFLMEKHSSGNYLIKNSIGYFSPILPCGRLLTNSTYEVDNYFRKLVIYEGNPGLGDSSYLGNALITQHNSHFNEYNLTDLSKYGWNSYLLQGTDYGSFEVNSPTGSDVLSSLKNVGFASLRGHGTPYSIACSGYNEWGGVWRYIQTEDRLSPQIVLNTDNPKYEKDPNNGLDLLDNFGKPFVLYSLGCSTTPFDYYTPKGGKCNNQKYNIGSMFTTATMNCGVAFIGNTRDSQQYSGKYIENSFMSSIGKDRTLGQFVCSLRKATTDRGGQYMLNLIGDPTLRLWLGAPLKLGSTFSLQNNDIIIGSPNIEDSRISLYDGIGPIEYQFTNQSKNSATIHFTTTQGMGITGNEGRDFLISVWQNKYLPDFLLVADNRKLKNMTKKYILTDLNMGEAVKTHVCRYDISDRGNLLLHCAGLFVSDNGLNVGNNGVVEVVSEISATLSNDHVEDGGCLEIKSPVIILDSGFSVEKGGCLTLSPL